MAQTEAQKKAAKKTRDAKKSAANAEAAAAIAGDTPPEGDQTPATADEAKPEAPTATGLSDATIIGKKGRRAWDIHRNNDKTGVRPYAVATPDLSTVIYAKDQTGANSIARILSSFAVI